MLSTESKAYEFDRIAETAFFPIYAAIAEQIRDRTGITSGKCLDVGSGGGHLGLSLACITDMDVVLLDKMEDAVEIAQHKIGEWGLEERVTACLGDVQHLPFQDGSMDLVISRGSVWFWEDQKRGFLEIHRVLAHGGMAYIGGGFGNDALRLQVDVKMKEIDKEWPKGRQKFVEGNTVERFTRILSEIGISDFEATEDEKGIWVVFRK